MNKNISLAVCLIAALGQSSFTFADEQAVTVGYAQSNMQHVGPLRGANATYRYEWESPVSIITSLTYLHDKESHSDGYANKHESLENTNSRKVDYWSLAAGPAYRINDVVSVYSLVGANYTKLDDDASSVYKNHCRCTITRTKDNNDDHDVSLMYGAGVQVNVSRSVVINAGYEGTNSKLDGRHYAINGFNVGMGYRF